MLNHQMRISQKLLNKFREIILSIKDENQLDPKSSLQQIITLYEFCDIDKKDDWLAKKVEDKVAEINKTKETLVFD